MQQGEWIHPTNITYVCQARVLKKVQIYRVHTLCTKASDARQSKVDVGLGMDCCCLKQLIIYTLIMFMC